MDSNWLFVVELVVAGHAGMLAGTELVAAGCIVVVVVLETVKSGVVVALGV